MRSPSRVPPPGREYGLPQPTAADYVQPGDYGMPTAMPNVKNAATLIHHPWKRFCGMRTVPYRYRSGRLKLRFHYAMCRRHCPA